METFKEKKGAYAYLIWNLLLSVRSNYDDRTYVLSVCYRVDKSLVGLIYQQGGYEAEPFRF